MKAGPAGELAHCTADYVLEFDFYIPSYSLISQANCITEDLMSSLSHRGLTCNCQTCIYTVRMTSQTSMLKHQQRNDCRSANTQNAALTSPPLSAKGNDSFIKVVITGYETAGYGFLLQPELHSHICYCKQSNTLTFF